MCTLRTTGLAIAIRNDINGANENDVMIMLMVMMMAVVGVVDDWREYTVKRVMKRKYEEENSKNNNPS